MSITTTIDLTDIEAADALHDRLAARLGFSNSYGRNWDAFWDLINDPEGSDMPTMLRLTGWATLATRLPIDAGQLRRCLEELARERADIGIAWIDDDDPPERS